MGVTSRRDIADTVHSWIFLGRHTVETRNITAEGQAILQHARIWLVTQLPAPFIDTVLEKYDASRRTL